MRTKITLFLVSLLIWNLNSSAEGALDKLTFSDDGICQISSSEDLTNFALAVGEGNGQLNAVLNADLKYEDFQIIGTNDNRYSGIFDGQGHSIEIDTEATDKVFALFGYVQNGTIQNLIVKGTIKTAFGSTGGICGYVYAGTLNNCVSAVKIISTVEGDASHGGLVAATQSAQCYFRNCLFCGSIESETTTNCGGFIGWCWGNSTLENCLQIGEMKIASGDSNTYARCSDHATGSNNYFKDQFEGLINGLVQITEEQLASGEVCYKLNGDQSNIQWTQTIGVDQYPIPFQTSSKVYCNSTQNCLGEIVGEASAAYSNEDGGGTILGHQYENGFCSVCGQIDTNYLQAEDGFYPIANGEQLKWFASLANTVDATVSAKLIADVAISGSDWPQIGNPNNYSGTFDGQGHKITLDVEANVKGFAIFRNFNGTAKNLIVDGTINTAFENTGGIVAYSHDGASVLNCVCSVNILTTVNGDATHAGIIAYPKDGQNLIRNCIFNGSIKGETTTNCGGIVGWCWGYTTIENVLQIGDIQCAPDNGNTISRFSERATCINVYYKDVYDNIVEGTTQITEEQLTSGELCYLLNGNQSNIVWTQTIGEDACPIPFTTRKQVYATGELSCVGALLGNNTFTNDASAAAQIPDHTYVDGVCTGCGKVDASFIPIEDGVYQLSTPDQLIAFSSMVNEGSTSANAILLDDIDMTSTSQMLPSIGNSSNNYTGTFDGNYHKITVNIDESYTDPALFGYTSTGAVIKNLLVDGNILPKIGNSRELKRQYMKQTT